MVYAERRFYPRYPSSFTVQLQLADDPQGAPLELESINLSQVSIQLKSTQQQQRLFSVPRTRLPDYRLRCRLPGQESDLDIDCRLMLCRRVSHDCYYVAFQFTRLSPQCEQQLSRYLSFLRTM